MDSLCSVSSSTMSRGGIFRGYVFTKNDGIEH